MPHDRTRVPKGPVTAFCCLWLVAGLLSAAACPAAADSVVIYKVYATDVRDASFVMSWTTGAAADGSVDWGTGLPPSTAAHDAATGATAHRVIVPDSGALMAATAFNVQVRSGDTTDSNAGDYYRVTTGATLTLPAPGSTIWGYVYAADGVTPAATAVVFLRVHDEGSGGSPDRSQWATARTDATGVWYYGLNNLRTADAGSYFVFDPGLDVLEVIARGGNAGAAELSPLVPADFPGGAAQLAEIVLAVPPAATVSVPNISLVAASDVRLSWLHGVTNVDYEIWKSDRPYFTPRVPGAHRVGEAERPQSPGELFFVDEDAAGAPGLADYYAVLSYDLGGAPGPLSGRVGEFSFSLTPGVAGAS